MSIFERLTPNKKKFLESLGIFSDEDMPRSFFETIEHCRRSLSSSEFFYAGTPSVSGSYFLPFCIKDVVGTDHDRYAGKTWIEAFCNLDRGEVNLEHYFINPEYYNVTLRSGEVYYEHSSSIGVIKKDGKYYVYGGAGGGNNRIIIMKIRYLAMAEGKSGKDLEKINSLHTFYGYTRIIPDNVEVANMVEQMLWYYVNKKYSPKNISDNPNIRLFNIMYGDFGHKEKVCGPLTENEFVEYSKELIDSFYSKNKSGSRK